MFLYDSEYLRAENARLQNSPYKQQLTIRPSPNSPFCTSPSQLDEITMENEAYLSSIRSPLLAGIIGSASGGGTKNCIRTRSVKEFEDQLAALKKENFNLKLRIYFLEERMGPNFNCDKEAIVKNNVDLHVEVVSLKNEIKEKNELLTQASKALDLQDEEHRRSQMHQEESMVSQRQVMKQLKAELLDLKMGDAYKRCQLEEKIAQLKDELSSERTVVDQQKQIIEKKCGQVAALEQNNTEQRLEEVGDKAELRHKYEAELERNAQLQQDNDAATEKISALTNELHAEPVSRGIGAPAHHRSVQTLCSSSGAAQQLRRIATTSTTDIAEQQEKEDSAQQLIQLLRQEINQQQQKIVHLKAEQLKACKIIKTMIEANKNNTEVNRLKGHIAELEDQLQQQRQSADLAHQSIVYNFNTSDQQSVAGGGGGDQQNSTDQDMCAAYKELVKQLEDKNDVLQATLQEKEVQLVQREEIGAKEAVISEKQAHLMRVNSELLRRTVCAKDEEIARLSQMLARKQTQLNLLTKRIDEELGGGNRDSPSSDQGQNQKEEVLDTVEVLRNQLEQSEKLRRNSIEACGILRDRLEEIATFLDALLRQKSCFLGLLGSAEQSLRLRQIVDDSLDLSRSVAIGMLSDEDLSVSAHLEHSNGITAATTQEQLICALRQQIVDLNLQVRVRDVELQKLLHFGQKNINIDNHSDTEDAAWSEPDRQVSRERIGLALKKSPQRVSCHRKSTSSSSGANSLEVDLEVQLSAKEARIAALMVERDRATQAAADLDANLKRAREECEQSALKMAQQERTNEERYTALEKSLTSMRLDYETNYVRRTDVDADRNEQVADLQVAMNKAKTAQESLHTKLLEMEKRYNVTRNELASATLQFSEAVLEKTQLANEKAHLEETVLKCNLREMDLLKRIQQLETDEIQRAEQLRSQLTEVEKKNCQLEAVNAELHNRLVKINCCGGGGGGAVASSDEDRRAISNASPDLGIESDQGRLSSLDSQPVSRPFLPPLQVSESLGNLLNQVPNLSTSVHQHDFHCDNEQCRLQSREICEENTNLHSKMLKMKRALEDTLKQLNVANQRKKLVEKTICKQLQMTSQVLKKAKANLDSGSELDCHRYHHRQHCHNNV